MADPTVIVALKTLGEFAQLAERLTKLRDLAMPEYRSAALGLYEICKKLHDSSEAIARWITRFAYFDFRDPQARTKFSELVAEYRAMRVGRGYHDLKYSCTDLGRIWQEKVESHPGTSLLEKLASLRRSRDTSSKLQEYRTIINELVHADQSMIGFITDDIFGAIDAYLTKAESAVDAGDLDRAEALRLRFKSTSGSLIEFLQEVGSTLSNLVIKFADLAKVPITVH